MSQFVRSKSFRQEDLPDTTQAAEGLMRRRWSIAEIEAATKAGILDEDVRFELIGGALVPMAAKSVYHEILKAALNLHFVRILEEVYRFAVATTFRLSEDTFVEPDFIFFRRADGLVNLRPATALLAIEVADTSLRWDLGRKATIYADFGIPELWVIDAVNKTTHIHSQPRLEGYAAVSQLAAHEPLVSSAIPGLKLTMSELETF